MIGRLLGAALVVATFCIYCPAAAATTAAGASAQVTWHRNGLLTWNGVEHRAIEPRTIHQLNPLLPPGRIKVIVSGSPGAREAWVHYEQRDGGPVHRVVLFSKVLRAPKTRVVAEGIGSSPLAEFEAHGIAHMASMTRSVMDAMEMVATGYTADSAGGGGTTAIGRRAGYGIVAVDPRIIPLGTKLYIIGYGFAVAGDTGGAILGHRIDLGFDSLHSALLFGRRDVTVYRIK
ncbi:MAG: 3D domain-containing protein [Candidatus Cybelea sp.]